MIFNLTKYPKKGALALSWGFFFGFLGILIRFRNYFSDLSFWCDEAALALNILDLNVADFFAPLQMNQVAPIGFCLVVKSMVSLLGNSEWVFRILPFLGGTIALFLAYLLVYRMVGLWPALLCVAQLSVSNEAIYYTNNFKPYSTDLAIALLLMLLAYKSREGTTFWESFGKTGVLGIFAIWFSFPAVFVMAGIGTFWLMDLITNRKGRDVLGLAAVSICWLASFYLQYHFLSEQTENSGLIDFWKRYFMPFPPRNWDDLYFFHEVLPSVFRNPLRTWHGVVSIYLFLGGIILIWCRHRTAFYLILIPLILNLVASGLNKYPFGDRMLFWGFINLMTPVAAFLVWLAYRKGRWQWMQYAVAVLIVLNLARPTAHAIKVLIDPEYASGMNHVFSCILEKNEPEDRFLVHSGANTTFFYYQKKLCFSPASVAISQIDRPQSVVKAASEVTRLKGRTWLVFDEGKKIGDMDYEKILVETARQYGTLLYQYVDKGGASAFLFQFHDP